MSGSAERLQVVSPIDGSVYLERELAGPDRIEATLADATKAQRAWRETPLAERIAVVRGAVTQLNEQAEEISVEFAWQMGRPVRYGPAEIRGGHAERALGMAALAPAALSDLTVRSDGERPQHELWTGSGLPPVTGGEPVRVLRRVPHGVVLVLAPWNYPFLTAVNAVVPALLAGNAVVLKHSDQTPLAAERMRDAYLAAGLPRGVLQVLHMSHSAVASLVRDPRIGYVHFTGSVAGGRAVKRAAADRFVEVGLELGGKDPAYVRVDADLDHAAAELADGAFFNSGQSCCGIERIYLHERVAEPFLERLIAHAQALRLGDPRDEATTLGPMARTSGAASVRTQIAEALAGGAQALVDEKRFGEAHQGGAYLAPQILTNVPDGARVACEESFGPVVVVDTVADDEEAVARMNDSDYGLTASIWTRDLEAAWRLAGRLATGTCYANRCDYLDPLLAWSGTKDSGSGVSLSQWGFLPFTRPMSLRFQLPR